MPRPKFSAMIIMITTNSPAPKGQGLARMRSNNSRMRAFCADRNKLTVKRHPRNLRLLARDGALSALQHFLNLAVWPGLTRCDHPHAALIRSVHQNMRTHPFAARLQVQIRLRFPAQRRREITRKNLPAGSVIELDDMAFRVRAYLHSTPKSRRRMWGPAIGQGPFRQSLS